MTDSDDALDAISRVAAELVPQLTERLRRHGLGEIEVAHGDLRLRVSAAPSVEAPAVPAATAASGEAPAKAPQASAAPTVGVASPAVGFFVYAEGLGPGLEVRKGDALGHVEMLGVRHDVRAPRGGTVRHLVAESGEAVEYAQVVLELDVAEGVR
ncbi:MAG: acetyl-CoA carboxylase, biotin carboxyl carrier protein [Chloroflexi bacterium]|nr:acetyl-CoA carboxylase, biotin carboxyl carrier protein [Chloroflexota bacterium]MBA3740684.1 acetyl-CoA carboxylase, biotin carboxyl carrier protein [Chloroflexota bacterium]